MMPAVVPALSIGAFRGASRRIYVRLAIFAAAFAIVELAHAAIR